MHSAGIAMQRQTRAIDIPRGFLRGRLCPLWWALFSGVRTSQHSLRPILGVLRAPLVIFAVKGSSLRPLRRFSAISAVKSFPPELPRFTT